MVYTDQYPHIVITVSYTHLTSLNAGYLWGRPFYIIRNAWNVINAIDDGKVQGSEQRLKELKLSLIHIFWSDRGDFVCEAVTQDYAGGSG